MGVEVHDRHREGTDRGRRQVDDLLAVGAHGGVVPRVGAGRRGVEDQVDVGELRHLDEAVDALVGGGDSERAGARQPVGLLDDADHGRHLEDLGQLDDLDHQIRADVARTDDRDGDLVRHELSPSRCGGTAYWPMADLRASWAAPAAHETGAK